ncbi:MAG TPA: MBL fold metallo-hydrolase [candidate division Zixibacteria bacterium]|nr:MBL fold metallo-hydrolase [candidate division Zixibacteria bacterium]
MTQEDLSALDMPQLAGGCRALTTTPIVGTPHREYAEMFVPGAEELEDGELRISVLRSGNPWVTRAQAAASILVEVGNPERDLFILDLGAGSLAIFASLNLPVNKLDKVFLTHLHADHTADLITLFGSYRKAGRAGPVYVWGPSGSEPKFGTKQIVEHIAVACAWDSKSTRGVHSNESFQMIATEFDFRQQQVVYDQNGVKVTAFPVIHALDGAVGYRIDFASLTFVHSGDTRPTRTLVEACAGDVDLVILECFPPAEIFAKSMDLPLGEPR